MNRISFIAGIVLAFVSPGVRAQSSDLRVVIIRHAEKPLKGDGLTCKGINRSQELVEVLHSRFGLPSVIYVPDKGKGDTKRSRMYQTILPFATKYGLKVSADFHEDELKAMAKTILKQRGVVLVVWEHSGIPEIARKLGVGDDLRWKDKDYDSLWIIRWENGRPVLVQDKEGLKPGEKCP